MTRKQAERKLRRLGYSKEDAARLLDATRAQREVMSQGPRDYIRVEYKDGEYTITR